MSSSGTVGMVAGGSAEGLAIRPVTAADVDPIAALQEASIMRHGVAAYGLAKARAWARVGHEFKHVLLEDGEFFVAEQAGERLGVGGWSPDSLEADVAWIRYLFVHPDHVRRGIGRRLVEVAEAAAVGSQARSLRRLVEPERGPLLPGARLSARAPRALAGARDGRARLRADEQAIAAIG